MTLLEEGINYSFRRDGDILLHKVISRPDITFAEGARVAAEMLEFHERYAAQATFAGSIIDFFDAPPSQGPKTRHIFAQIARSWAPEASHLWRSLRKTRPSCSCR